MKCNQMKQLALTSYGSSTMQLYGMHGILAVVFLLLQSDTL